MALDDQEILDGENTHWQGSKNVTVMVVYAYTGRGKEANAKKEDTVVGLAACLRDTH